MGWAAAPVAQSGNPSRALDRLEMLEPPTAPGTYVHD